MADPTMPQPRLGFKTCRRCLVEKPLDQFQFEPRVRSQTTARCSECIRQNCSEWTKANPGRVKQAKLRSLLKNKQKWDAARNQRQKEKRIERRIQVGMPALEPRWTEDGRRCSGCRRRKPEEEFPPDASRSDGVSFYCKPCANRRAREHSKKPAIKASKRRYMKAHDLKKYGLTIADFDRLVDQQNGNCAICLQQLKLGTGGCGVDHNHTTLKVRGILCRLCNVGIGHFSESPELMLRAIDYLRRHEQSPSTGATTMKISLKTPMFLNGHRYNPGDVVDLPPGTDGPYDSNGPAFDVIDEESWNERAALTAKHAKEREEMETPDRKRAELLHRQHEESAELRRKHAEKELVRKHEREAADLEAQHKAQAEAFKSREPEHVAPPRETSEAQLGERHKVESEELAKRQEAEKKALAEEHKEAEERKAEANKKPESPAAPAPTKAPIAPDYELQRQASNRPPISQGRPMTEYTD